MTHLLREHRGPNQETPVFLVYYDTLSDDEQLLVSGFENKRPPFPELLPGKTTLLFNLSQKNDWNTLYSLIYYIVRHS